MLRTGSCFLVAAALAPLASADRVITNDNRVIEVKKAREKDGGYVLQFEHGEIVLPDKKLVKAVEIEGDMSEYVPQNDDEKQKLAQGFVKYRGRWLSKPAYTDELAKQAAESKRRADDIASHADWSNAWSKETKHFIVNSNTSPELLDYYCELLETYYGMMDDRFGIKPSPSLARTKMTVNIFKSKKDFTRVAQPGGPGVLGYFNRVTQQLNFFHNYSEPAQTEWVALHECTHLLTYLIEPQYVAYPEIWLNEAVADFFGSSEISRDKKGKLTIKPGALQADRLLDVQNAIKDGDDIKLPDLMQIDRNEYHGFEYAHGWAFIYFLNESRPDYRKGFDKFFKDIYTQAKGLKYDQESVPSSFDKSGRALVMPASEMRRVVLDYLKVKEIDALEKEWKTWIGAVPLSSPEQLFKRSYQAVVSGRIFDFESGTFEMDKIRKKAQLVLDDLDAAVAKGIKDPRAQWARSEMLTILGKRDDARAALQLALEADPLNARYHWEMGQSLYSGFAFAVDDDFEGSITIKDDKPPPKPSPEAAKYFGLATELAPDNDVYREQFAKMMGR